MESGTKNPMTIPGIPEKPHKEAGWIGGGNRRNHRTKHQQNRKASRDGLQLEFSIDEVATTVSNALMELAQYTLKEPDEAIFRSMCAILFPGESSDDRLNGLKDSVFLDTSAPTGPGSRSSQGGGGRDPIWLDQTSTPNSIVLGYYDHENRKVVLFDRVIERVEKENGLGERFGVGTLFRVVLAHELAHWLTWENASIANTELSETLAELVSWTAFSKLPDHGAKDAALGCQHWLNEEAPVYWYRTYWLWLVLCGFRPEGNSLCDLTGDFRFVQRLLEFSQKRGHVGFRDSLALTLNEFPDFNQDEIPPAILDPWKRKLEDYDEAYDRLMQQCESAIFVGRIKGCGDDVQTICDILSI